MPLGTITTVKKKKAKWLNKSKWHCKVIGFFFFLGGPDIASFYIGNGNGLT